VRKSFAYLRKNSLVEDVIPFDKSGKRGIIQGAWWWRPALLGSSHATRKSWVHGFLCLWGILDSNIGYPNRLGYLAPYKGTMYHSLEFRKWLRPCGGKEGIQLCTFATLQCHWVDILCV
jgi:hypothetical protein